MNINEVDFGAARPIEGYGPGFFRLGGQVFEGAVIFAPGIARLWGGYDDLAPLLTLAGQVDLLFIGTGATIAPLPRDFRSRLEAAGLGVDMMASPTAARSYNVLLSEGRRIAVALLPV